MPTINVSPVNKIEVTTEKQWETISFRAVRTHEHGQETIKIDVEYNHHTKRFRIYQANQEMIRFNDDSIEQAEMRVQALIAAIEYLKTLPKEHIIITTPTPH